MASLPELAPAATERAITCGPDSPCARHAADEASGQGRAASRRGVLGVAAVGAGAGLVLAGCGSSGDSNAAPSSTTGSGGAYGGASSAAPSADAGAGAGGTVLGATSEVPVGGGMIFSAQKVVVTQPTAGSFKAFSSTCTHQGCQVNKVSDGLIMCPCHGSRFSIADGSVKGGPAPAPLPAASVNVRGTNLVLGT
ncbi:Rieske (2Fe-2S) protein [Frankia canadensis]|uniref:Cytochrome bc1 complex Rieske iron-sulfur subunit n=1 Tax=Frankia canadensis TaxID=1836972 RepID=A0A2I2KNX6_9ACTN|nr:Rieske (2Fe-2S) protein [Frankia canadensis]SNQ47377.1 Rieske (2Fe-2S) protein [Frankia canadensis]SOU54667.1 Rieske (2Fe-2S) protein [Frankia canadensis]